MIQLNHEKVNVYVSLPSGALRPVPHELEMPSSLPSFAGRRLRRELRHPKGGCTRDSVIDGVISNLSSTYKVGCTVHLILVEMALGS